MSRFSKSHPGNTFPLAGTGSLPIKKRKPVPHEFVLEALAEVSPWTRPMFGCFAIYVEEKIVLILRDKQGSAADNGVWLATTKEHHESLRLEFPTMRSIQVLGGGVTGWQVLPAAEGDFEAAALRACELIVAGDPRIGKVPGSKRPPRRSTAKEEKLANISKKKDAKGKRRRGR